VPHHSRALYQQFNEYFDLQFGIFVEGSWDFAIAGDQGPESTNQFPRDDGTHPLARRRPRRALHRLGPLTGEGTSAGCFVSADELARNDAGPCPSRNLALLRRSATVGSRNDSWCCHIMPRESFHKRGCRTLLGQNALR
jgi:hypothetical protein